ncbi:YciI family protein [Nocardioides hankookensis]
MKYLMFVATDPDRPADVVETGTVPIEEWVEKNDAAGTRLLGERLRPADQAVVVRRRDGKVSVTEGPFAETHEWIVGFDVLECADLDEAIEVAAAHPMAASGRLELRAFWED